MELKNRGIASKDLLFTDESKRVEVYNEIARTLGIRSMKKKEDISGFMQLMIDRI